MNSKDHSSEDKGQINLLKEKIKSLELSIDGAKDGVWDWNLKDNTFSTNIQSKSVFGYNNKDIKSYDDWISLINKEDLPKFKIKLQQHIESNLERYEDTYRIRCKSGEYRWVLSSAKSIRDENGNIIRMAGSHTDITDQKKMEEKLYSLAYFNELTDLYNRSKLQDYIKKKIKAKRKFAIIYMDVDNFRRVNDTWGYTAGDDLLKYISRIMLSHNEEDFIYTHLGSDDFAIVVNKFKSKEEITDKLEIFLQKFQRPWKFEEKEIFITFSIGIVIYPDDGENLSTLLVNADTGMWHVKKHGKDGMCFYNKEMQINRVSYIQTANQIKAALKNKEFVIYYQPQINLETGKVTGLEALIRWLHPEKGLIPPMEFIPLAEKTGQIYLICSYVLEEVCRQKYKWKTLGYPDITVSVNISGITLTRDGIVKRIKKLLEKYEVNGSSIKIEVTETAIMTDLDAAIDSLNKIRELGVKVALDDFGTGYSSLTYLQKLPIDVVKIDREFIKNIKTINDKEIIVQTVIQIAKALELEVVAEGVETKEQLNYLLNSRCIQAQGYLFCKPMPVDEMNEILKPEFRCPIIT